MVSAHTPYRFDCSLFPPLPWRQVRRCLASQDEWSWVAWVCRSASQTSSNRFYRCFNRLFS